MRVPRRLLSVVPMGARAYADVMITSSMICLSTCHDNGPVYEEQLMGYAKVQFSLISRYTARPATCCSSTRFNPCSGLYPGEHCTAVFSMVAAFGEAVHMAVTDDLRLFLLP